MIRSQRAMNPDTTRVDYQALEQIAKRFAKAAVDTEELLHKVKQRGAALHKHGWVGRGAAAFFGEMDSLVYPASQRMVEALQQGQQTLEEIIVIFQAAEQEAAELFKGQHAPGPQDYPAKLPQVVSDQPVSFNNRRQPHTISQPTEIPDYGFRSGNAPALKYDVEINGQIISVHVPKNCANANIHSINEVANGSAALPQASRTLITRVDVEPQANPDDAFWAKEYNTPNFSSYMTAGADGIVRIYPTQAKIPQDQ